MLRKCDGVELDEFEKFGFKYGAKDKFLYKTKQSGIESRIYIDLQPYHNNNELYIECPSNIIPEKITDKLYDLITAGLVEKVYVWMVSMGSKPINMGGKVNNIRKR